jgi:hypothetical protein
MTTVVQTAAGPVEQTVMEEVAELDDEAFRGIVIEIQRKADLKRQREAN